MIYGETQATINVAPTNTNYNLNNIVGAILVVAPVNENNNLNNIVGATLVVAPLMKIII